MFMTVLLALSLIALGSALLFTRRRRSNLLIYVGLSMIILAALTGDPLPIPITGEQQLLATVAFAIMVIYYRLKAEFRKELNDGFRDFRKEIEDKLDKMEGRLEQSKK